MLDRRPKFVLRLALIALVGLVVRLAVTYKVRSAVGLVGGGPDRLPHYGAIPGAWRGPDHGLGSHSQPAARYPVFLTAAYGVRDVLGLDLVSRAVVGVAQSFVGAATVVLTGLLGRRLVRSAAVGLIAAALVAIWPSLVLMTAVALTETLFLAVFMAALTVLFWDEDPRPKVVVAGGALLGAAFLVRSVAVMALLVAAVWLWGQHRSLRDAWRWVGALGLGFALVVAPWVLRNAIEMRALIVSDTNSGYNLCTGNHPGVDFRSTSDSRCNPLEGESELDHDRRVAELAWRWISADPVRTLGLVPDRVEVILASDADALLEINGDDPDQVWGTETAQTLTRLLNGFWRVACVPAIVGLVMMVRSRRLRWPVLASAAVLVPPLIAAVAPRYHLPAVPMMAIAIGVASTTAAARVSTIAGRLESNTNGQYG